MAMQAPGQAVALQGTPMMGMGGDDGALSQDEDVELSAAAGSSGGGSFDGMAALESVMGTINLTTGIVPQQPQLQQQQPPPQQSQQRDPRLPPTHAELLQRLEQEAGAQQHQRRFFGAGAPALPRRSAPRARVVKYGNGPAPVQGVPIAPPLRAPRPGEEVVRWEIEAVRFVCVCVRACMLRVCMHLLCVRLLQVRIRSACVSFVC